ncbi:MAG: glycerol-3-phosphate cytidylyltransferase [Candidatus Moranbacteria bacterium]|nr:glycerol-3-phosphate cytidylyltransferase [Candidatus Moranbacteria bacterium]
MKEGSSKNIIGYTTGVFDLFHIGHLNMLRNAKSLCDTLIVGVTTDELVTYKNKEAVIPFEERAEIVRNIKYVDLVVPQFDMDKIAAWKKLKFDKVFVGDDWFGTEKWDKIEEDFKRINVPVIYFPYTRGTSSTLLAKVLADKNGLSK